MGAMSDHTLRVVIDQIVQHATKRSIIDNEAGAGPSLTHPVNPKGAVLDRIMQGADARSPMIGLRHQKLEAQKI